nr:MarR family transcriptional regulator [Methanomassiliicoccus luminyensis]
MIVISHPVRADHERPCAEYPYGVANGEGGDRMNHDVLKLENQICFPIYACAREVVKKYKPFLDEIDLTYTQYIAMMVLWEHKRVGVKDLGEHLYLDSGTLTPLLKRLEAKGLVQRERSKEDERAVNITITEMGEKLKEKAKTIPAQMGKCIPLSLEEAETLYALLYKLLGRMDRGDEA